MMPMPDLNQLAHAIHQENLKWWQDMETGEPIQTPTGRKEMLMVSEVAEAMEGLRKEQMDDKLPHRAMAEVEAADYVIRVLDYSAAHHMPLSVEEPSDIDAEQNETMMLLSMCEHAIQLSVCEYAWRKSEDPHIHEHMCYRASLCIAAARVFCDKMGYDLWAAVDEKRAFNRVRPDHKIENRKKDGGKKW